MLHNGSCAALVECTPDDGKFPPLTLNVCVRIWIIFHMIKAYVYLAVRFFSPSFLVGRSLSHPVCPPVCNYGAAGVYGWLLALDDNSFGWNLWNMWKRIANTSHRIFYAFPHLTYEKSVVEGGTERGCELYRRSVFGAVVVVMVAVIVNVWHLDYGVTSHTLFMFLKSIENGMCGLTSVPVLFAVQPNSVEFWTGKRARN